MGLRGCRWLILFQGWGSLASDWVLCAAPSSFSSLHTPTPTPPVILGITNAEAGPAVVFCIHQIAQLSLLLVIPSFGSSLRISLQKFTFRISNCLSDISAWKAHCCLKCSIAKAELLVFPPKPSTPCPLTISVNSISFHPVVKACGLRFICLSSPHSICCHFFNSIERMQPLVSVTSAKSVVYPLPRLLQFCFLIFISVRPPHLYSELCCQDNPSVSHTHTPCNPCLHIPTLLFSVCLYSVQTSCTDFLSSPQPHLHAL